MMKNKSIDCAQFFSTVSDYYDDELSDEEKKVFEKHFKACRHCMNFFDGFYKTMKMVEGPVKDHYKKLKIPPEIEKRIIEYMTKDCNRG